MARRKGAASDNSDDAGRSTPAEAADSLSENADSTQHLAVLAFASSLNLEGPPDWSENLDQYLYGGKGLPDV